jgi:hypothetical protein
MNRRTTLALSTTALLCLGVALPSSSAVAQQKSLKDQLLGTWTLVSVTEVYQDGRKETPFGPAVKGAVSFDGNGKFTLMIIGADLPNPSGNPRESSRLAVAYFGTSQLTRRQRPSPTPPSVLPIQALMDSLGRHP